jgi:N-acetylmuramoyl-L-alanine amidase
VLEGINSYFTEQPPPGTLYAARAAARWGNGAATGGSP